MSNVISNCTQKNYVKQRCKYYIPISLNLAYLKRFENIAMNISSALQITYNAFDILLLQTMPLIHGLLVNASDH